ncbi:MAG: tetratricopeptide repeat protein, partial [Candidatus Omnitrophota bacterium]
YMKGLKIDELEGHRLNLTGDYNMIGELYMEMDNLVEAEKYFNQALSLSKEIDAQPELANAYYDLGLLAKKKGQKNKAREFLRLAQEIYRKMDVPEYQQIKQEFLDLDN